MSQDSRPQARGLSRRRRRQHLIEAVQYLEERQLLAPVVDTTAPTATAGTPITVGGTVSVPVTITQTALTVASAAPYTTVSEFAPIANFGSDIVQIQAGPGGDFGNDVYAISRGAGDNETIGAINRPGVIYRVDPATGKASVFFDLNTVVNQYESGGNASNSVSTASGFVNWYSITFDPEGVFDGKPTMFVSSVDRSDPAKNIIYEIGSDGSFLGAFAIFSNGQSADNFTSNPTAILVPPVNQEAYLKGLIAASGSPTGSTGTYSAVYFAANAYSPGQNLSTTTTATGEEPTSINAGPVTALAPANTNYTSPDYATFTDFGPASVTGFPATPGLSGVQGLGGDLLINGGVNTDANPDNAATPDLDATVSTNYRRYEDEAFDSYGYFSYGTTGAVGAFATPTYTGSLFVADLSTGLTVPVTDAAGNVFNVPVQGPGTASVTDNADGTTTITGPTGNLGGRIVRISPTGVIFPFASGFHTSGAYDSSSFIDSSLSITFSADGTTMYVADDDAIWQFKTVTDLASSDAGSVVGLNDLRTLGVPYDGEDSAVAIVDTGVDAATPALQGKVSTGRNIVLSGATSSTGVGGNDDTDGGANAQGTVDLNGHGTPVAGIVAQFVPQATLDPIDIFTPNQDAPANSTSDLLYQGLSYLTQNAYVNDPVRPGQVDRVIAAELGFGTTQTFQTEGVAYKQYPQIVISLKDEAIQLRKLGIQPIAAAGQLGSTSGTTATTATVGDVNGMSLPAILNEVISVTGNYPFPFTATASTAPTDPPAGVYPRLLSPILVTSAAAQTTPTGTGTDFIGPDGAANLLTATDLLIFEGKILNAVNRSMTTDFVAPAIDVPTFSRTYAGDGNATNVFDETGTSESSAVVTGAYALVSSALGYWANLSSANGVTSDAYLTTPVGARTLNFGAGSIENLSAYDNPDGINSILQWTAIPITDSPTTLDSATTVNPPTLFGGVNYREYSQVNVANAIAAIEGSIAINYLTQHNDFPLIDANHDGLITATELQTFEDNASTDGLAEAGAMARLLGGNARIPGSDANPAQTEAGEQPDQPDVLQRRFNFFDYAADGTLNGVVAISQYVALAHNLLPSPDAFKVNNRQASSADGYLLSPAPERDISDLQHTLRSFDFAPTTRLKQFKGISPARFGVNKAGNHLQGFGATGQPMFTLFSGADVVSNGKPTTTSTATASSGSTSAGTATTLATTTPASTTTATSTTPTATTITTTTPATTTSSTTTPSTTTTTPLVAAVSTAATPSTTASTSTGSSTSSTASTTTSTTSTSTSSSNPASGSLGQQLASIIDSTNTGVPQPAGTIESNTVIPETSVASPSTTSTATTTSTAKAATTTSTAKKTTVSSVLNTIFNPIGALFSKK